MSNLTKEVDKAEKVQAVNGELEIKSEKKPDQYSQSLIDVSAELDKVGSIRDDFDANKDFYTKRILFEGKDIDSQIVSHIGRLVGLFTKEKLSIKPDQESELVNSEIRAATDAIINPNPDMFAKALFYNKRRGVPCGVMIGFYEEAVNSTFGGVLYIEKEFRRTDIYSKLVNNFKWWSREIKKADKVFVNIKSQYIEDCHEIYSIVEV